MAKVLKTEIVELTPGRKAALHEVEGTTAWIWRRTQIGSWPLLLIVAGSLIAAIGLFGLIGWFVLALIGGGK